MTKTIQRFADGLLARLVPQVDVAAACTYIQSCGCRSPRSYSQKCYDCPGVPRHCGPCNIVSGC